MKVVNSSYGCRWFAVGIFIGALIGLCIEDKLEDFLNHWWPLPSEVVCQKGKLFEQITVGGSVYLKTDKECIETDLEVF